MIININKLFFLTFGFFSVLLPQMADAQPVDINSVRTTLPLDNQLYVYYPQNKQLQTDNILTLSNAEWKPIHCIGHRFQMSDNTYWVKFTISNTSHDSKSVILEQNYTVIDRIDLYEKQNNQLVHLYKSGLVVPFYERAIPYHTYFYPLKLKSNATTTYYVRYHSHGPIVIDLRLHASEMLYQITSNQSRILYLMMGMFIVITISSIVAFFITRRREYIIFSAFTISLALFLMIEDGTAFKYFWPANPISGKMFKPVFLNLAVVTGKLFYIQFMKLKKINFRLYTGARIAVLLSGSMLLSSFFLPYTITLFLSTAVTTLAFLFTIYAGIHLSIKRYRPAYFYLIGWLTLFAGTLIFTLKIYAFIPYVNEIFNWTMHLGAAMLMIIFPAALVDNLDQGRKKLKDHSFKLEGDLQKRTTQLFVSELGIDSYVNMINKPSNKKDSFVDAQSVQHFIDEHRASLLKSLSRDLFLLSDFDELITKIISQIIEISGAQKGAIYMTDTNKQLTLLVAQHKYDRSVSHWDKNTAMQTFTTLKPITATIENKTRTDRQMRTSTHQTYIPIVHEKEAIGICYLENSLSPEIFSERMTNLLYSFLSKGASAIQNAYQHISSKTLDYNKIISSSNQKKINKVINYLNNNYNSNISREGLASMVDIHPDSLGRFFKLHTNKKINEYVNELRIKEASKMLATQDANVIDIAYSVGFDSLTTFNRSFTKFMGTTPSDYRKIRTKKE